MDKQSTKDSSVTPSLTYAKKIAQWTKEGSEVEAFHHGQTATGTLIECGKDYAIVRSITKRDIVEKAEGEENDSTRTDIIEIETLLRLSDVEVITRITKKQSV